MNIFLTVNVLGFLITIQILQYVIIIYVKQMLSKIYWFISVIYTFGTQSNWNQMCELCHSGKLGSLQGLEWKLLRSYLPPLHIHENLASLTFRRLFFTAEPLHFLRIFFDNLLRTKGGDPLWREDIMSGGTKLPGHLSTRTSVHPDKRVTRTNVHPDKNARAFRSPAIKSPGLCRRTVLFSSGR